MNEFKERLQSVSPEQRRQILKVILASGEDYNIYPLSSEQSRMWFLYNANPDNPFYNITYGIRMEGTLDITVLEKALTELYKQQRVLTTTIIDIEGQAFQLVNACESVNVNFTDMSETENTEERLRELINKDFNTPFKLTEEFPIRLLLIKKNRSEYLLLVTIHHMFCDGWSMGVFFRELKKLYYERSYGKYKENSSSHIIQYTDYAVLSKKNNFLKEKEYWKKKLFKANLLTELPVVYPRPLIDSGEGATVGAADICDYGGLKNYCRDNRISIFSFFLGVYGLVLYSFSGENSITVGTPVLNRSEQKWSNIMGLFANTIPISLRIEDGENVSKYLCKVHEDVMEALDNGKLQFDEIVELMKVRRKPGVNPIFQSTFSLRSDTLLGEKENVDSGLLKMSPVKTEHDTKVQFDFSCTAIDDGTSINLEISGRSSLFSQERLEEITGLFRAFTGSILGDCDSDINLLVQNNRIEEKAVITVGEKYGSKLLQSKNRIQECAVVFYRNLYCIFYKSGQEIRSEVFESVFGNTLSPIMPVRLNSIPLTAEGDADYQRLFDFSRNSYKNIRGVINELSNESAVEKIKIYGYLDENKRFYYKIQDMLSGSADIDESVPVDDNAQATADETSFETAELSFQDGGELPPVKYNNLIDLFLNIDKEYLSEELTVIQKRGRISVITYGDLIEKAKVVAANLQKAGVKKGSKVILEIDDLYDFYPVFWGCIISGLVAIPLSTPHGGVFREDASETSRFLKIAEITRDAYVIGGSLECDSILQLNPEFGDTLLETASLFRDLGNEYQYVEVSENDYALMMFTSGSTGVPKGVPLTNRNVVSRTYSAIAFHNIDHTEVLLNWMPMEHVGGIIMSHIQGIGSRSKQIEIATTDILHDPVRWITYMSDFKVTRTWAPNFAYGLVLDKKDAFKNLDIDLSHLSLIQNGGEAINFNACHEFMMLFRNKGLKYSSMIPCWGMTETSSGILMSDSFGKILLKNSVGVGRLMPGVQLRIVDDDNNIVPAGRNGSLQMRGETVHGGYYMLPEENKKAFTEDGWFITGDCAVLKDGDVIITGRTKEIMIINGVNVSCLEVEKYIEEIDELQTGTVGCSAIKNHETNQDEVCIFYGETDPARRKYIKDKIAYQLSKNYGFSYDYLVPVPIAEMPRSSIGKIEKNLLVRKLQSGEISSITVNRNSKIDDWFSICNDVRTNILPSQNRCDRDISIYCAGDMREKAEKVSAAMWKEGLNVNICDADGEAIVAGSVRICIMSDYTGGILLSEVAQIMDRLRSYPAGTGDDGVLVLVIGAANPLRDIVSGYAAAMTKEYRALTVRVISYTDFQAVSDNIVREINAITVNSNRIDDIKYIGDTRYCQQLKKIGLADYAQEGRSFVEGGTYVLIGGLGGIGFHLSKYLLKNYNSKLIIIGRKEADKVESRLDELRELGNVRYEALEIIREGMLSNTLKKYEKESIQGIVCMIGEEPASTHFSNYSEYSIAECGYELILRYAGPSMLALQDIDTFIRDKKGIDVIMFSSATALFGGETYAVYSAVNRYLLNYKLSGRENNYYVYAWSKWNNIGMNYGETINDRMTARKAGYYAIEPKEGIASLEGLMKRNIYRAVIGIDVFNPSISSCRCVDTFNELESISERIVYHSKTAVDFVGKYYNIEITRGDSDTEEDYPDTISEAERKMLQIWGEILENNELSVKDEFFQAGGTSLKVMRLINQVNEAFSTELTVADLFAYPSVRKLTGFIVPESENDEQVEVILI